MFCPQCGKGVREDQAFCPHCGAPLKQQNLEKPDPKIKEGTLPGSGSVSENNAAVNSETHSSEAGNAVSVWFQNWTGSLKVSPQKQKRAIIIASVVLAVIILIIVLCCTLGGRGENGKPKSKTDLDNKIIDISDFATFVGYDGEGLLDTRVKLEKIGLNEEESDFLRDFQDELDDYKIKAHVIKDTDPSNNYYENGDVIEGELVREDGYPIETELYGYTLINTTFRKKVTGLLPRPDTPKIKNSELVSLSNQILKKLIAYPKNDGIDNSSYDISKREFFDPRFDSENRQNSKIVGIVDMSTFKLSKQEAYVTTKPTSFDKKYFSRSPDSLTSEERGMKIKDCYLICHYSGKISTGETIDIFAVSSPIVNQSGNIIGRNRKWHDFNFFGAAGELWNGFIPEVYGEDENIYNLQLSVTAMSYSNLRPSFDYRLYGPDEGIQSMTEAKKDKETMLSLFQKLPSEGARQVKF